MILRDKIIENLAIIERKLDDYSNRDGKYVSVAEYKDFVIDDNGIKMYAVQQY